MRHPRYASSASRPYPHHVAAEDDFGHADYVGALDALMHEIRTLSPYGVYLSMFFRTLNDRQIDEDVSESRRAFPLSNRVAPIVPTYSDENTRDGMVVKAIAPNIMALDIDVYPCGDNRFGMSYHPMTGQPAVGPANRVVVRNGM